MQVGLRDANQQFARIIRAVPGGQEVLLTDRGRPIAVIKPIEDQEGTQERVLRTMAAEGLLIRVQRKGPMPRPRWRPVTVNRVRVSKKKVGLPDEQV